MNRKLAMSVFVLLSCGTIAIADTECAGFNTPDFFMSAEPQQVADCIEAGADLTRADRNGLTPLFHAVRHATSPIVLDELLWAANEAELLDEVLSHRDRLGRGIMHVAAAEATDPAMLTWLVSWGALVLDDYDCGEGWLAGCSQPIHLAAQRPDSFMFVATLLALGSMSDPIDKNDRTPAEVINTRQGGAWLNTLALLTPGDWPDSRYSLANTPSQTGQSADCPTFLTAEFFANASAPSVRTCLARGAYPTATDNNGNTAIHLAAAHATDPGIIDVLLHHLRSDNPDRIETALAQTNLDGRSALQLGAEFSTSPEVVGRLLAWGAEVDQLARPIQENRFVANRGTTALHLAARRNDPAREAILTVLLAGGADTRLQDHALDDAGGRQALHYAARHPDARVVLLMMEAEFVQASLLEIAQRTVIKDDRGNTALHVAANYEADFDTMFQMVTSTFPSPDDANNNGISPLMRAAEKASDLDIFLLLLNYSETPCVAAANGVTVEAYLRENPALNSPEPSGAEVSALEAYKDRCP